MHRDQLDALVDSAWAATESDDRGVLTSGLSSTAGIRAWCDAQDVRIARRLDNLDDFGAPAEVVVAEASRCNRRDAERVVQRATTADAAPQFGDALADGKISAGHIDQLTVSLRQLEGDTRTALLADTPRLLTVAAQSTPDEFGRALRAEVRRLMADDGMARLDQQRAAVRLHRRVDTDGMNIFTLALDPLSGLKLHNQISAATEALFHDKTPECCPSDPLEKQSFLRAHALINIIDGKGIRMGKPEIVVVVDTTVTDTDGAPVIDWGLPVELPRQVLVDLFQVADTHAVVVRNGAVLHAPGEMNLGRSTRLASPAQRRALRAIYPTCAMPDCTVPFDNCTIHHVDWWEHGGHTNLNRLIPQCNKHHHRIHDHGWAIRLDEHRTLTITYPDGTTMKTGPPKRHAA